MENKKLSQADYRIFLLKSLLWLGAAGLGFALALVGFFYASIVWIALATAGIWLAYQISKNHVSVRLSLEMWVISTTLLLVVILFSIFSTPTVFSGRDQGSISEAAARLAQNHTLEFSTPASTTFFKIYGPGRALNFPGFYYTGQGNLITQFPLAYIVWLALFFALFGTAGFIVANAVLLFLFLLSFYMIMRLFLKYWSALPTLLFAITSFVFMWFSKYTLSENMALPLLWLGILALMLFLKNPRKLHYVVFLASFILLFFTRIEGIAFLAIAIAIISLNKEARGYIKEKIGSRFFLPAGIFLIAFAANAIKDINFYREIAKAILPSIFTTPAQHLGAIPDAILPNLYLEKIFYLYGMLGFFIVGAIGIIFYFWKREFYKLVPLFVILPTFIYFLDPHISPDYPWMLRRYLFSLLPAAIFYSGLLLGQCLEKNTRTYKMLGGGLIAILLLANLSAFTRYLSFSENKNLLTQTKALSGNFSSNDLILVDQQASGDGWSMISGPMSFLYGKNSAYFFNTNDLAKLDLQKFAHVYLIAPSGQVQYYMDSTIGSRLTLKNSYALAYRQLDTSPTDLLKSISFPGKKEISVSGKIFEISK